MKKKKGLFTVLTLPLLFCGVNAQEMVVNTQDGEMFVLEIDPRESLETLQTQVASFLGDRKSDLWIAIPADEKQVAYTFPSSSNQGESIGSPRIYENEVTAAEKADIRFIVTTLANKSLLSIALVKGDLESAGDRISHIHPLRFLMTIFTDEELKVGIRNIRSKNWAWSHFIGGIKQSLSCEARIGNLGDDFLNNFVTTLNIKYSIIQPAISQQKWDELVDLLITHIPRLGDHDHYDT